VAFNTSTEQVTGYAEDPANPGKANRLAMLDPLTLSDLVLQLGGTPGSVLPGGPGRRAHEARLS
jgi:hypothetical protein